MKKFTVPRMINGELVKLTILAINGPAAARAADKAVVERTVAARKARKVA